MSIVRYNKNEEQNLIKKLEERGNLEYGDIQKTVEDILADVRKNKDEALFKYTEKFDGVKLDKDSIKVTEKEIEEAFENVDKDLVRVMEKAAERIADYHRKQLRNSWLEPNENGEMLGQLFRPLEKVGVYVPGGKAAYPSSVLMNIIPAKVAGVPKIIMTTPPNREGKLNPATVAAAKIAGIDEIYKVGGAQAVAALAFGTESIPKADKIVGPGNIFVALAKRAVYGYVSIDSIAGPSEILVLADEKANPVYIAADLLSQAEHDELASAILITTSEELAKKVQAEIEKQTAVLERKDIINKSIDNYGGIFIVDDIDTAVELSNKIAPEHMEVCIDDPFSLLPKIKNAGAVFLGNYTPEPMGDYMAGPNHVLPTNGTARFFSPLNVDDYIKKTSLISFSQSGMKALGNDVIKFAQAEGLTAHANSIRVRM
ncbi:MAG: histidinol dehydrogenase [Firmicutes bacterium]|nr:histidinol dehydrogenase [Bacillota bacterium]